jgi:hypothetical protein
MSLDFYFELGTYVVIGLLLLFILRYLFTFRKETAKEDELMKLLPTSIYIKAQRRSRAKNINAEVENQFYDQMESIAVLTGVSIKIEGKGGTKSAKTKNKTPKEKLDVLVSNLRRYFYWQPNVDATLAEQLIDLKLKEIKAEELFGYKKSKRTPPPSGYSPLN